MTEERKLSQEWKRLFITVGNIWDSHNESIYRRRIQNTKLLEVLGYKNTLRSYSGLSLQYRPVTFFSKPIVRAGWRK